MTKNKKTIVFFNGFYLPHLGGVERYTAGLISGLKDDYNICVVTSNVPDGDVYTTNDGIEMFRLPTWKMLRERFPIIKKNSTYKNIVRQLKDKNIDHIIINTRYYGTTILGLRLAREKHIVPILIDHSSDYILKPYEIIQNRRVMKYSPNIYAVSECTSKWLKRINIKTKGVFYNSVNKRDDFVKKVNKTTKIIYAGRLLEEKGVNLLVDAYDKLKNKYNVSLEIIGDGPLYKDIKEKHQDVILTGTLSHEKTLKEMEKADIFVFPTLYPEGFPTVILEAAMQKCAIISTDRGGIKELITDDDIGMILKNDASDLTEKLESLLKDPEKIRKYGEKAFKKTNEKFTWDRTIKTIKEELRKYENN